MNFPEPRQILTGAELPEHLAQFDRIPSKDETQSPGMYHTSASPFGIPGRDHASTLLYLQTVEANYGGDVRGHNGGEHMRWQARKYPVPWNPEHGSRLWDGSILSNHDDFDCLEDLETIGLLVDFGTGFQPMVRLTKRGHEACAAMIAERSELAARRMLK